ncbi:MAG: flagellar export chaperone FliS [bacterium]
MHDQHGIKRYQQNDHSVAGPEKIIVMLYEAADRHIRLAKSAIQTGNHQAKAKSVNAAQAIFIELRSALDFEIGGDIARNLDAIYEFMIHENLEFLVDNDVRHLENVLRTLTPVLNAWRKVPPGAANQAAQALAERQSGEPAQTTDRETLVSVKQPAAPHWAPAQFAGPASNQAPNQAPEIRPSLSVSA